MSRFFAIALVAATATASLASAQDASAPSDEARKSSLVTFYGHVFGHGLGAPMPSNTQFPVGEDNYGLGSTDYCTPVGTIPDAAADCDADPNNKLVFYSTAGFVQVSSGSEFTGGGGYQQLHNERGSTKDIVLDTTQSIKASVYISQDQHAWLVGGGGDTYCTYPNPPDTGCLYPYWGWDPGVAPAFVVKASFYHAVLGEYGSAASDMPPIAEALADGSATLIAEGQSAPLQAMNGLPGAGNVQKYEVDLGTAQVEVIPKESSFFIVFSIYNDMGGAKFSTNSWRWWSGEFFPPTYTLPVKNPFDVESVVPQYVHGKLAILGIINTPWGSYDVDPEGTKLTVKRDGGEEVEPVRIDVVQDYSVAHGAHYKPVNVTYVWDYKADKLKPGTYTATISARNNQGTASAECTAKFTILDGGEPGSVEPAFCGQQTEGRFLAQEGDEDAPAATGPSRIAPVSLPLLGVAGLVILRRRWDA